MTFSIQLYSLRNFMEFDEMLNFCKGKGFDFVEPAGLYNLSPKDLAQKINAAGLKAPSFHLGLPLLQERWEELAQELKACAAENFVVPFSDAATLSDVEELADRLQKLSKNLAKMDIKLHYHNHAHELYKKFGGSCFLDLLLTKASNLNWQVDVGWVTASNTELIAKLEQWKSRISILHIKDILAVDTPQNTITQVRNGIERRMSAAEQEGGQPVRIGEGVVDFESLFAWAKRQDIQIFVLENDNPSDVDMFLDSGLAILQNNLG